MSLLSVVYYSPVFGEWGGGCHVHYISAPSPGGELLFHIHPTRAEKKSLLFLSAMLKL